MDNTIKIIIIILAFILVYFATYAVAKLIHYLIQTKDSLENKVNVLMAIIFIVALIALLFTNLKLLN